jgi:MscS family membrane protein
MDALIEQLPVDSLPWLGELWIYKVFAIIFFSLVLAYLGKLVLDRVEARAGRSRTIWDDALVLAARRPL